MACCGKKRTNINIPADQKKIVEAVQSSSIVKSNRSRPGTIAKQCPICGSKSISSSCPICKYKF